MAMELLTALLVIITAVYVILTHHIAQANRASVAAIREQTSALNRPYLVVNAILQKDLTNLYLRIANLGRTAATNLHLSLDRDFYRAGRTDDPSMNLGNAAALKSPIRTFSHDQNCFSTSPTRRSSSARTIGL